MLASSFNVFPCALSRIEVFSARILGGKFSSVIFSRVILSKSSRLPNLRFDPALVAGAIGVSGALSGRTLVSCARGSGCVFFCGDADGFCFSAFGEGIAIGDESSWLLNWRALDESRGGVSILTGSSSVIFGAYGGLRSVGVFESANSVSERRARICSGLYGC